MNRVKIGVGLVGLSLLLSGCATRYPGNFTQLEDDRSSDTSQFRYRPETLDKQALQRFVMQRCLERGYDTLEALAEHSSALPGYKTRRFQCTYTIQS